MNFQVFHVNPGKKLKKKDVNNNLSHFMSVFPTALYHVSNSQGQQIQKASKDGHDYLEKLKPLAIIVPQTLIF